MMERFRSSAQDPFADLQRRISSLESQVLKLQNRTSSLEFVEEIILGSNGLIDFQGISDKFSFLHIHVICKASSGIAQGLDFRINNLSSSAYSYHTFYHSSSSIVADAANVDGQTVCRYGVADTTNEYIGEILLFNKLLVSRHGILARGVHTTSGGRYMQGYCNDSNPISRVTLGQNAMGNLASGSRARLYGGL